MIPKTKKKNPWENLDKIQDGGEDGPNYDLAQLPVHAELRIYGDNSQVYLRIDDRTAEEVKLLLLQYLAKPGFSTPTLMGVVFEEEAAIDVVPFKDALSVIEWVTKISADFRAPEKFGNTTVVDSL